VQIFRSDAKVTMEIQDEGRGMQDPLASTPGVGVAGMRERVRQLGGELEILSSESGTTLKVVLPLR
jgi:signal transduction histidine kinase